MSLREGTTKQLRTMQFSLYSSRLPRYARNDISTYNQMKKNLPLAILSGLLLWIAWPPTPYTTFLLFIGFVPMLLAIENIIQSTSAKKGKQVFTLAFIGFFIWNTASVYWVYNALKIVGELVA